ncbi:MAG TPA: SLC13 family permease [Thermomicrobiales bacterium]|nr:SLC13 family permease [Thermomicrobiales bacterium]
MSDQTITLLILAVSVVVFVWNYLPVGIVALGVALALWATDVLTLEQSVAGFGSTTVVLIAALFVVAEALDAAGITTWAGQLVVRHSGDSKIRFTVLIMLVVAVLAAVITTTGSVAAMYPLVVVLAVRMGRSPSKFLLPIAFAGHAGSMLVLTGSAVTLLISEASYDAGGERFGFLELALVGVPLLAGTMLVVVLFGDRLLPDREARTFSRDLSQLPETLRQDYVREEQLARLDVPAGSSLIGQHASKIAFPPLIDLHILSVQDQRGRPLPDDSIEADSVLVVRGSLEGIGWFAYGNGLRIKPGGDQPIACGLVSRDFGVAEVIVSPRSSYIGDTIFPGMVTDSGQLVVLSVQRHGEDLGVNEVTLKAGDSLLLQGSWDALDQHTIDPNVILVDTPDSIRRQTVPLGPRAVPALVTLAAMVVLLTTGIVPAMVACLLAAIAMVLLRVVTVEQAHRSMQWTTLILVAGMIPLSTAISDSGAAQYLAEGIIDAIGGGSPYVILLGLFLITAVLGQMISNTATALVLIPIVASVAVETDLSVTALMMCINVAAAAALMTPVATPANVIVMEPAGYRFTDYWKLGLAVMLVYLLVGVFLVPVFWPL